MKRRHFGEPQDLVRPVYDPPGYYGRPDPHDWTTDDLGYRSRGRRADDDYYEDWPQAFGSYAVLPPEDHPHRQGRRHQPERDFWDKAEDEIASWFGDDRAAMRRDRDRHRGKGPKGYRRSDMRINEDVHDRLTEDPYLDASDISVTVADGEVTLDGFVGGRADKRRAEDCFDAVSGVRHVQNNLRYQPKPSTGT